MKRTDPPGPGLWLRGGQLGDPRAHIARSYGRLHAGALLLLALATASLSCEGQDEIPPEQTLAYHARTPVGAPMKKLIELCDGPICPIQSPLFSEIEYVSDSSAKVKGYLLRTPAPKTRSVQLNQERFEQTRQEMVKHLGQGETFLKSADPTYWPRRGKAERVVTLTTEDDQHSVLAIGAVGPDSGKIPKGAAAHDPKEIGSYWEKIARLPALAPSGK